ncbi:MAG: magnesium transporter [Nitrospirota bacterium]|nr:magnesium transporter [Nitrospirota bacterium]MDE3225323.1 magnesium transporter [Nitrospirota bacterium]MDE3243474.1 magnesium transporter [Nitrospirota bacterium]
MPTAADLMTRAVPRANRADTVGAALAALRRSRPEEAGHLYLVDDQSRLVGQVPIEALILAEPEDRLDGLRGDPPVEVHPEDNAESVALTAVERHDADVAVVDAQRRLVGAIPIGHLLAQLHEEHVDDLLRLAGVGPAHPLPTEQDGLAESFKARMPWLLMGLVGGWLAAGVASLFEAALEREIVLAFFLPLVVYMADAVGTQTETVLVRALAYGKVSLGAQLLREGLLGLLIGGAIGGMAAAGLLIFDGRGVLAAVVGLTLAVTALVATLMASLLPLGFVRMGADPALASGPIATVLQDILSVAVYLSIATALL